MELNKKEKEVLNYVFDEFAYNHFDDIGYDADGNPISYDDDTFRLEQFKALESITNKLKSN